MRFSKILKGFTGLGLFLCFQNLNAQEEFLENVPPPPTDGMFDDQLEPLDQVEPVRPQAQPQQFETPSASENGFPGETTAEPSPIPSFRKSTEAPNRFPSPRAVSAPKGKSLPDLPFGNIPNPNEKVRLDFVQVELEELLKYFAERVHRRFIYDPTMLSGKVTIISPTDVTLREAWGAFLSALEVRGYIVYPAGEFLKIEKAANARKAPVPVITGETPNDDSFVTRIINLKYLGVNDIRQAVRNLLSRTAGDVIEHPQTNTLILSDYAFNIRRIVRILNLLDVEGFQEQITVLPLKYASASDIARKVTEFFPSGAASGGSFRTRAVGSSEGGVGIPSTVGGSTQSSVVSKIVPDDRTNSLIVLGSERGVDQVRKFVDQLDVPVEGGGGQIHVYYLQNVKAEDISQTLAALAQGLSKSNKPTTGGFPTGIPNPGMPPSVQGAGPTTATLLSGDVKITADTPTNSLVIQASPRDFDVLKSIIQKLDIRRRQVFIESAILEASSSKGLGFGVQASGPLVRTGALQKDATSSGEAAVKSGGIFSLGPLSNSIDNLLRDPASLTGMALGFRSGGTFDMATTDKDGNAKTIKVPLLTAILRLSANDNRFNVLSTPHILATANEEATISIGKQIPQITSSTSSPEGTSATRNYTRVDVTTDLNITPQINADDYLTLKIKQKVNSVGEAGPDGQYNTIKREATTTAIVKDQQTIVIGGLMEDRKTIKETKVPLLGDIPILGWLFKDRQQSSEKTNLLLFLTPYIIKDTADMNDQFFRKLKEREKFLKDSGMSENKGVPVSGLTDQQIKMLDAEYVKSLRRVDLEKIPHETQIEKEIVEPSRVNPSEADKSLKVIEPIKEEKPEAKKAPELPVMVPAAPAPAPVAPVPLPAPIMPTPTPTPLPAPKLELEDSPPEAQ